MVKVHQDDEMKVLIVDDSSKIRYRLMSLFSSLENVDVVGFTGNEDMEEIHNTNPDFIVLDINLVGKSGIEILKSVKKTMPEVQVAMLTNHFDSFYSRLCKNCGADYFFDKSMDFELLASLITEKQKMN